MKIDVHFDELKTAREIERAQEILAAIRGVYDNAQEIHVTKTVAKAQDAVAKQAENVAAVPDPVPDPAANVTNFAPAQEPVPFDEALPSQATMPAQPAIPVSSPSYTVDDLARAAAPLMDAGKLPELQALLQKYGVKFLPELRPDQLGAFATDLRQMGAAI